MVNVEFMLHLMSCFHGEVTILDYPFPSAQVRHLDTSEKSELHKLQQLKDEQGVLLL